MTALTWLGVPGDESAWTALGFVVDGGGIDIGRVRCAIGDNGWGFDDLHSDPAILGLRTVTHPAAVPVTHPCGVSAVDHVVFTARELDSSIEALNAVLGVEPRKRSHPRGPRGPEMAFYRVGEAFIEVVATGGEPALIGLALKSPDLDATVSHIRSFGGPISDPRPAVQGGRIASVWSGHLNWGLAIMGP